MENKFLNIDINQISDKEKVKLALDLMSLDESSRIEVLTYILDNNEVTNSTKKFLKQFNKDLKTLLSQDLNQIHEERFKCEVDVHQKKRQKSIYLQEYKNDQVVLDWKHFLLIDISHEKESVTDRISNTEIPTYFNTEASSQCMKQAKKLCLRLIAAIDYFAQNDMASKFNHSFELERKELEDVIRNHQSKEDFVNVILNSQKSTQDTFLDMARFDTEFINRLFDITYDYKKSSQDFSQYAQLLKNNYPDIEEKYYDPFNSMVASMIAIDTSRDFFIYFIPKELVVWDEDNNSIVHIDDYKFFVDFILALYPVKN